MRCANDTNEVGDIAEDDSACPWPAFPYNFGGYHVTDRDCTRGYGPCDSWMQSLLWRTCPDHDAHHGWARSMGLEPLLECEWGWHPGRDWRVRHIPSYTSEVCQ